MRFEEIPYNPQPVDVLIVMGSPLQKRPSGEYYVPLFADFLKGTETPENVDGDLKARATSTLIKDGLVGKTIVTGGIQDQCASRAITLARHIEEGFDIEKDKLIPLTTKPHSMGNLEQTGQFLATHPELLPTNTVGILTTKVHLERAATFALKGGFLPSNLGIMLYCAEGRLMERGELSTADFYQYYLSSEIQGRKANEQRGIADFHKGTYRPRS